MIRKAVWHMFSTEILTRIWLTFIALALGAVGVRFVSPWIACPAGLALFVLIYRLRYKHF
ncbi:MAG TPA: hypothetical protein VK789_24650 [Bryobacteraceae bacterium]|jgi:hypothetical protein|nr:hypothetical protein [Bryobacteraceae bacterium]